MARKSAILKEKNEQEVEAQSSKALLFDDPKKAIIVRGARVHNLRSVSVAFPRGQMTVVTGLSGSGKSSLAFDTLYAEGQRRYVESLSSYARQFLGRLDKPDVDAIEGISPAIAIEQKVSSRNARSTVGTSTEIYDYLKLLFARIGRTYSPVSGDLVQRHNVADVVAGVRRELEDGERYLVVAPLEIPKNRSVDEQLDLLRQQGFVRIRIGGEVTLLADLDAGSFGKKKIDLVIDRLKVDSDESHDIRLADSVETAFFEGKGTCIIVRPDKSNSELEFSNRFELDGMSFEEPSPNFFSFNNPVGACKRCEGFGQIIGIDEDLVVPNKSFSIYDDAIVCWKVGKMNAWKKALIRAAGEMDIPIHRPYKDLSDEQVQRLWEGDEHFSGINGFFSYLESKSYKIQYRVMLSRYRGRTTCPDCKGTRLRKDASYVKVAGKSIVDLVLMPSRDLLHFFASVGLDEQDLQIGKRLLTEIQNRLQYLNDVGLGYLTLNRLSNTLSGGESQRINLATCLGSNLTGSMYILDEPSIGLHPRDTHRLIRVLKALRGLGNTVIVVEHDEEIMEAADYIVDMGPKAGVHGGQLVFAGTQKDLLQAQHSLTADYLTGNKAIPIPPHQRPIKRKLRIENASMNNLKNLEVDFPLHCLCAVSGVSGSGKSTLVSDLLHKELLKYLEARTFNIHYEGKLSGDLSDLQFVEYIDQNPIGKSSRSNPVTYVKAYDDVRSLFAAQATSKARAYKPSHFSFNVPGGRCENCEGEGEVTVEMQFMADIKLTCEVCKGRRFKDETLEVRFQDKNIDDILHMTVDEALEFFDREGKKGDCKRIVQKLRPLQDVGLGYLALGQSSSTLSGGEAQRIKLASFLARGERQGHTLFIFDEPTTGLHMHDVGKLMDAFKALIEQGHSLIVIEHNLDVLKCADWIIDLGPDGGELGGEVVFAGRPNELIHHPESLTTPFLKRKFTNQ